MTEVSVRETTASPGWVRLTRACVLLRVPYYKLWRRVTAGELSAEMIEGHWYVREAALARAIAQRERLSGDKRRLPRGVVFAILPA